MSQAVLPKRARVVVIGGGIIGTSVAYHLAHMGWKDVVLLERDRLTSGTTWHAAGLMVTFGSTSETSTEMRKYTRDLYSRLEAETGLSTGFKAVGFIEIATEPDRLEEYRRVSAFNRYCGVDVHEISAREVRDLFPLAKTDDILAGFYVKEDGRANPVDVTMAMAKGARMRGATILEGVPATGFLHARGAVTGVRTPFGDIESEYVVNCAGVWARQLGAKAGVNIPLQSAEHYYLITEKIAGLSASFPVLEDPASYGYFREEVGGLMIGLFEPICAPWNVGGVPGDFSFGEITPDWDRMGPYVEKAMQRVPVAIETGVRKFFCGPESFTPDLQPVVGEAPELKNYFVAAGMNSIGILTGGGLGRVLAHWIVTGRPDVDVTGFNIDRLHAYQANPEYRRTRTVESLGMVYKCHYPTRSLVTARGAKKSPVHDRLAARGAFFRDVSGWEGADWYGPPGVVEEERLSWGRQNWFPFWAAEHKATRRRGHPHGHVLRMAEVQGRGARRRPHLELPLRQQRRRRARARDLHAVAERGRQARGRSHGAPSSTTSALHGGRLGHRASPRRDLDAPPLQPRRARLRLRRDVGLCPNQRPRPPLARAPPVDHDGGPARTTSSPSAPRARDRHRLRARPPDPADPPTSPRRARLRALRPYRASHCTSTIASWKQASASISYATPDSKRSRVSGWRRGTATTGTTSTTPTRSSRQGSASRSI